MNKQVVQIVCSLILLILGLIFYLFKKKIAELTSKSKGGKGEFPIDQKENYIKNRGLLLLITSICILLYIFIKQLD